MPDRIRYIMYDAWLILLTVNDQVPFLWCLVYDPSIFFPRKEINERKCRVL